MYDPAKAPAILVTGASTGIGEDCAITLARMGYRVYAGVRRSLDAHRMDHMYPLLNAVYIDVTNASHIAETVRRIETETEGRGLYALVNNAGIAVAGPLEFLPIDEFRRQMEVNVTGLLAMTQACLPMLRRNHGRIVNIGSTSGRMATPFTGAYAASKFAVEAITDTLRRELDGTGIAVSVVEPGAIATPIWEKSSNLAEHLAQNMPPAAQEHYARHFDAMRKALAETVKRASPTKCVSDAVVHAITAQQPRTRYVVGSSARTQMFMARFLPDRLVDHLVLKFMGLR